MRPALTKQTIRNILNDKVFRASSLLFLCMTVGNVLSFLYQAFMSRALTIEEFGMLNSLLSFGMIISLPIQTLNTTIANLTSHLKAREAYHNILKLLYSMLLKVSIVGVVGILTFFLFSNHLKDFLNMPSIYPILVIGTIILFNIFMSVTFGILQGLQSFIYLGITGGLNALLKLAFGILLVYLGLGVEGALGGIVLGMFVVCFASIVVLRFLLHKLNAQNPDSKSENYTFSSFSYSMPVLIALLCFTSLTNVDLVLVRHFFSPEEAGNYAVAAVLGKAVLFLPGAIVLAMFPIVSESHALKADSYHLLKKSLALAGLLSLAGVQVFIFFPELLVTMLMGAKHASVAPLVRLYGVAMFPFVFINIFMFFNLATHRMKFLYTFMAGSLAEVLLICLYHDSLRSVIYLLIFIGCAILALNVLLIWDDMRKSNLKETPLPGAETTG